MKKPGLDLTEITIGDGALAGGEVWVKLRIRMFLNRGEEVKGLWGSEDETVCFYLNNREIIAGLRYAVDGMRVGGRREAVIAPHLAFGETGIPGFIPSQALLRGVLELLEVGQPGEPIPLPKSACPGRSLCIMAWGEESSPLPRWQLTFNDTQRTDYPNSGSLSLEWNTRSDGKWGRKSAQRRMVQLALAAQESDWIIENAQRLPADFPSECLSSDQVHSFGGLSPTRSNADSVICWSVTLFVKESCRTICYLRETSLIWFKTEWGKRIMSFVSPHLTGAPCFLKPKTPMRLP